MDQPSVLLIDIEKCTGCRICENVCSLSHTGRIDPGESRITVVKDEEAGIDIPVVCMQCERPLCMEVCPSGALGRDPDTGGVTIDPYRCIGCRMCVMACPVGGITVTKEKQVKKCDLCGGDPYCAKFCPTGAIVYQKVAKGSAGQKRKGAIKMIQLMHAQGSGGLP